MISSQSFYNLLPLIQNQGKVPLLGEKRGTAAGDRLFQPAADCGRDDGVLFPIEEIHFHFNMLHPEIPGTAVEDHIPSRAAKSRPDRFPERVD
jgi:hypothetical protein